MKLAAIYNVFDGVELLRGSMDCLKNDVDLFIIVWQDVSNFGEQYDCTKDFELPDFGCTIIFKMFEPFLNKGGTFNESLKRNIGLEIAKDENCTHFLHVDCDEYYHDFAAAKIQYIDSGAHGSVCKMYTYFKKPTLRLENPDNYFVPFIHELRKDTFAGGEQYPFYVDPTRKIQAGFIPYLENEVVLLDTYMHHFSWIRKDIERKVRNSSAKKNIERSQLLHDYYSAETKEDYFLKDYNQKLVEVENLFSLNI